MSEVTIRVNDRDIVTTTGTTILRAVMDAGIPIDTACGGAARCHLCRVTITEGREALAKANDIEYKALGNVLVAQGMRLACQVELTAPLSVTVPEPRPKRRRGPPPRPPRPQRKPSPERKASPERADKPRDKSAQEAVSSNEGQAKKKRRRRRRPRRRRNKSEGT